MAVEDRVRFGDWDVPKRITIVSSKFRSVGSKRRLWNWILLPSGWRQVTVKFPPVKV